MTLNSLQNDLVVLGFFLIAGFIIRSFVKPFQKWFLPASVIGGALALIMGEQVLGFVEIPKSFAGFSGSMMNIIMTCVVFGVSISAKKVCSYLDYTFANIMLYGAQMVLGLLLGRYLSTFWTDMPNGWGVLGVFSFFGSHGSAGVAGKILDDLGSNGALGVGMILSTIGMIVAMTAGMVVVNYGVRKGWGTFVKEPTEQPDWFYGGALPKEQKKPIGLETTSSIGVNSLIFHLAMLLIAFGFGSFLFAQLVRLVPATSKLSSILYGMVGGLILWPVMCKLRMDVYVDKKTMNTISGFCLEILILSAIASLKVDLVTRFAVPILIYSLVLCSLTLIGCVWYFKKLHTEQWFEKCVMVIGTCTGSSASGFALVRAIDPHSQAVAPEAHGVYNALFWWNNFFTAIIPTVLVSSFWGALGMGCAFFLLGFILCVAVFGKKEALAA